MESAANYMQVLDTGGCGEWWQPYPNPIREYVYPSLPSVLYYNTTKSIRDFSDEEIVAEIKRRKSGQRALDSVEIKEGG